MGILLEQQEEDYYKPVSVGNFWIKIISNMKVVVTEIKTYQKKSSLTKLNPI